MAVLLVSSPVLPISEALSSATQLFPHHCTGSPSQLWGFRLCFALLLPCRVSRGGTTFLQGLSSQRRARLPAGPGEGEQDPPGCSSSAPVPVPRTPQAFRRWPSCSTAWDRRPSAASSWGTSLQGAWGRPYQGGEGRGKDPLLWPVLDLAKPHSLLP